MLLKLTARHYTEYFYSMFDNCVMLAIHDYEYMGLAGTHGCHKQIIRVKASLLQPNDSDSTAIISFLHIS